MTATRSGAGLAIGASLCLCLNLAGGTFAATAADSASLKYPVARRGNQVDDYHGVKVADPYRWMEDIDSPETRAWVTAEGALSRHYLDAIPGRAQMTERLRRIWNFERWSAPERFGKTWIYTHNDGLQNQSVVEVADDPSATPRALIDPNTLAADGTVALGESAVSADGRLFAYALNEAGSDWQIWHVRDVASGKDLPDEVKWSKFGGAAWRRDASGFYYTAYDPPQPGAALKAANQYVKLYFHRLGTPQSADTLVYARSDRPDWEIGSSVSDDGRYLVVSASLGTDVRNTLLVEDLSRAGSSLTPVVPDPVATFDVIGNVGETLFVRTDLDAPRFRVLAIDLSHPERGAWRTVIPEGADPIDSVTLVGGQLLVHRLKDAHSAVARYATDGKLLGKVALPGLGDAVGFQGHAEDTATYFVYSSYATAPSVYRLDLATGRTSLWRAPHLAGFEAADYETRQVFYRAKDGTRVPMFITARKGTRLDGHNPTILYGYGGFDISITPRFSPAVALWVQMGGVYAVANLRGGGEYGRAWHEAGMKTRKQTVFDDFIAAAQYLIEQHWTDSRHLAINGASNGGLLIGAVEEQRPDLFAAAVPQVGVMDMLRFREFTVGKAWESDYGSVDHAQEFRAMLAYSPVHNARPGRAYPPTLVMTGDHDDRVFPAHSFKFAAAMQHADPAGAPILLRVETRAGHGQGMPTAKRIEEVVDIYSFILQAFGLAGRAA